MAPERLLNGSSQVAVLRVDGRCVAVGKCRLCVWCAKCVGWSLRGGVSLGYRSTWGDRIDCEGKTIAGQNFSGQFINTNLGGAKFQLFSIDAARVFNGTTSMTGANLGDTRMLPGQRVCPPKKSCRPGRPAHTERHQFCEIRFHGPE